MIIIFSLSFPNGNILSYLWPNAWPFYCRYSKKLQNLSWHIWIGKYYQCCDDSEFKKYSAWTFFLRIFFIDFVFWVLLSNLWCFPITSWHRWWAPCIGDDIDIVGGSQWWYNESVKLGCPPRNGKVVTSFLFKSHVKAQNSASLQSQGHFHSAHSSLTGPTLHYTLSTWSIL